MGREGRDGAGAGRRCVGLNVARRERQDTADGTIRRRAGRHYERAGRSNRGGLLALETALTMEADCLGHHL